jgi:transcriptional regulator with XRE-family HTH domain
VDVTKLHERIKAAMVRKGITPTKVAEKLGVSRATVNKWVTGKVDNIESDNFIQLAMLLEVNARWLAGVEDDPQPWEKVTMEDAERRAIFRALDPGDRNALVRQGKALLHEAGKLPSVISAFKDATPTPRGKVNS